ncbi:Protein of unknown function, partial [Cotesia congregata]
GCYSSKIELSLTSIGGVEEGSFKYTIRKKSLLPGDKGWYAKVPKLYPQKKEIKIKLEQELNLKCTGHREIKFFMFLNGPSDQTLKLLNGFIRSREA